ncbi:MAG: hypothetical protein CW691_08125 [Candidatus Bathyarchaeum sp.]|nr:MAG: hypothetical protein CW691_08125 [Candidatus Bathyarchaeum sp.]
MIELNMDLITKTVIPRVLKATVWGSITFLIVYCLPIAILSSDVLPIDYGTTLVDFALISVFFVVVGQLFSDTLIGCGFGIARAIVIMFFFFSVADGGIFSVTLPITEAVINLTVDISIILLMIVSVNLFDIAKNLLEAITILTEKTSKINMC